jgi:hypothetical protein
MQYFTSSQVLSSLVSQVGRFPLVGFSGSRHVASVGYLGCQAFLSSVPSYSGSVAVGCARGVDHLVRQQFPAAQVFRVQPPISRVSFARRSARLVHHIAQQGGLLVVFPSTSCPSKVAPSSTFAGHGSGSWGSAALAVGLGVPVLLFCSSAFLATSPAMASRFSFLGSACGGSWWVSC